MISIDVKNSQPFHFTLAFRTEFWRKNSKGLTLNSIYPELRKKLKQERIKEYVRAYSMFCKPDQTLTDSGFYMENFTSLVTSGKLYEFICYNFFEALLEKDGKNPFITRDQTKSIFLQLMYFDQYKYNPKIEQIFNLFKKVFPKEAEIMELLKSVDYRDFPILLQKIESKMLLNLVARKIFETNPDICIFPIHDSIITLKEHEVIVKKIVNEVYQKIYSFTPQLKVEDLTEENAYKECDKYVSRKIDQKKFQIKEMSTEVSSNIVFNPRECEHWDYGLRKDEKEIITTRCHNQKLEEEYMCLTQDIDIKLLVQSLEEKNLSNAA